MHLSIHCSSWSWFICNSSCTGSNMAAETHWWTVPCSELAKPILRKVISILVFLLLFLMHTQTSVKICIWKYEYIFCMSNWCITMCNVCYILFMPLLLDYVTVSPLPPKEIICIWKNVPTAWHVKHIVGFHIPLSAHKGVLQFAGRTDFHCWESHHVARRVFWQAYRWLSLPLWIPVRWRQRGFLLSANFPLNQLQFPLPPSTSKRYHASGTSISPLLLPLAVKAWHASTEPNAILFPPRFDGEGCLCPKRSCCTVNVKQALCFAVQFVIRSVLVTFGVGRGRMNYSMYFFH